MLRYPLMAIVALVLGPGCRRADDAAPTPSASAHAAGQAGPAEGESTPTTAAEAAPAEAASAEAAPPDMAAHTVATAPAVLSPVAVLDRLRTDEATHVSIVRGGSVVAVVEGPRRLQLFDGSRGRLLAERAPVDELVCRSNPALPGGLRSLWLRPGADGAPRLTLFDHVRDAVSLESAVPAGRSVQCAGSLDGTVAIVVTEVGARWVSLRPDAARPEPQTIPLGLTVGPMTRVVSVLADERGAAFVAVVEGVPFDRGARVVVLAYGGEGGRRVRELKGITDPAGLVLSPSGNSVASGGTNGTVLVHSAWTGGELARVPGSEPVAFVDGDVGLVTRDAEGTLVRWRLPEREPALEAAPGSAPGAAPGAAPEAEPEAEPEGAPERAAVTHEAAVAAGPGALLAAVSEDGQRWVVAGRSEGPDGVPSARLAAFGPEGDTRFDRVMPLPRRVERLGFGRDALALHGEGGALSLDRKTGAAWSWRVYSSGGGVVWAPLPSGVARLSGSSLQVLRLPPPGRPETAGALAGLIASASLPGEVIDVAEGDGELWALSPTAVPTGGAAHAVEWGAAPSVGLTRMPWDGQRLGPAEAVGGSAEGDTAVRVAAGRAGPVVLTLGGRSGSAEPSENTAPPTREGAPNVGLKLCLVTGEAGAGPGSVGGGAAWGCVDVGSPGSLPVAVARGSGVALGAAGDLAALLVSGRVTLFGLEAQSPPAQRCGARVGRAVDVAVAPEADRVAVTDGRDVVLIDADCEVTRRILMTQVGPVVLDSEGRRGRAANAAGCLRFRRGAEHVASDAELGALVHAFDLGDTPL